MKVHGIKKKKIESWIIINEESKKVINHYQMDLSRKLGNIYLFTLQNTYIISCLFTQLINVYVYKILTVIDI